MPSNTDELKRREAAARAAIARIFGTAEDEFGATMFVSHHLAELAPSYWKSHLSTEKPEPRRVLELLVLSSHWGGKSGMKTFDFTLPEEVTNYLIAVSFDKAGEVESITLES